MKRIFIFLIITIIFSNSNKLYSQNDNEVDVTYVGNSGFLIKIGDKKILIDALFKGFAGDYNLPQHIQEKLNNAQAPFDDVDLIIVTHAHGDHINASMVQQHMKNNSNAIFASTKQTVDALNARDTLDDFHERRIGFNPTKEKSDKKEIQGITIESFLLPHGPDSRIINNGFLVSVNGITFFHTGDVDFDQFTFEEFRSFQLPEQEIDLSFIQHFYLTSDSASRLFVTKGIGGKYIFPIHYHFTTPSFDEAIVKANYPDAILFDKELESWEMPDKNGGAAVLSEYYYNQPLPGDSAVIFAPGIFSLSDRLESNIAFSPDGKECYFGSIEIKDDKASYKIYCTKYVNNKWTESLEAPFSVSENVGDPFLSADGKRLYFAKNGDIWMVERTLEGWSEPQVLPSPINSDSRDGSYTETTDGVVYISSRRPGGFGGIDNWRIRQLSDQSLQAENLGSEFNTNLLDYSPFIAPDESYFIFGSYRKGKHGQADLFISFNKGNEEWTAPINMNSCGAKVNNTTAHHSNPSLSPDGKFLFFRRHETMMEMDVYWVNIEILKKLKKKAMQESSLQKFTDLKGDYLGQTPPGDVPVMFAPGIISVDSTVEHGYPSLSPDGNLIFWQSNLRHKEKETEIVLKVMRRVDGQWTEPEISPYGGMPAFSPDGKHIYFIPIDTEENGLYFVSKQGKKWSDPKSMDLISRFPDLKYMYAPSVTNNGTLYFFGHAEGLGSRNDFGIYRSELINGIYAKPELLPSTINAADGVINWMPFIAADESYLLFSSDRNTRRQSIYISFRLSDGSWTEAHGLGEAINSQKGERFPYVSPDGKYLFFTRWHGRDNEDIMWVSADIIDEIKTQVFADISLKEEMFKAVNADDLAKVKALIKSDPSLLESKDKSGSTPLIRACLNYQTMGRQVEVAKFLIEAGANVNVINNYQATALLRASVGRGPDYELIKLLIEKGANVNIQGPNGITSLHWAVMYNDLKVAKLLLESGANINISNDYNGPISISTISGTVLHIAINLSQGNEMFKLVIENGAKLNIKDSQGNTELHLVALKGNTKQAKILIEHGIDLNAENNFNCTALYYAAKHGYRGVAELLIASGADKNTIVETNYGKAKQLSESIEEGEAYIWDLRFRYAVKTKNNLLVFTYGGGIGESSESALANGFLNADELKDQKITMFLRHRLNWKMDGKRFTELAKLTADVNMVASIEPDFSKMAESEIPAYHLALPNESFSVNGLKVHPIPALAHGMGYLVEVDGLKIFHAGLHISDDKPEHIEKFRKEIDFLKPFGPIDIVMLSTHSHSNYVGIGYEQYLYLLDKLAPKAIYLWGANVPEQYVQCAEFLKAYNIPIVYPEIDKAAGERSHYTGDKTQKK